MSRRRRRTAALVLLVLLAIPVVEIFVLVQVGRAVGPWWTFALLVLASVLGIWMVKREGRRAWDALRTRVETGQVPARELVDGTLVVLGGALLICPGFVSDAFGLLLILPFTRPLFRGLLSAFALRRVQVRLTRDENGPRPGPTVVQGEVIDPPE